MNYIQLRKKAWEKALELSKILRGIYESEYELEKLYTFLVNRNLDSFYSRNSFIWWFEQRKQAELCENIVKKERYECNYFLVGFYGKKFPNLLRVIKMR